MVKMTREQAREYINGRLPYELVEAKAKSGGYSTYICPQCGNGEGKDGTGIATKDGKHYKCFKCDLYGDYLSILRELRGASSEKEIFISYDIEIIATTQNTHQKTYTKWAPEVARYNYVDLDGNVLHFVSRRADKSFPQGRPDPSKPGGINWNLGDLKDKTIIYNLPAVTQAIADNKPVFVVEGEKDVDNLAKYGYVATTNPQGASKGESKWRERHSDMIAGATLYICPDNDDVGRNHAQQVAKMSYGKAKAIYMVDLLNFSPRLETGGDISDCIEQARPMITPNLDENALVRAMMNILVEKSTEYQPTSSENALPQENEKAPLFIFYSDIEPREVRWLWNDIFVQGGLNSIQGAMGLGKSFLLCAISAAVSNGGYVQGINGMQERLEQGNVLYLSGDDDPNTTLRPRLDMFRADVSKIATTPLNKLSPTLDSPDIAKLFEKVAPKLVILDTLQHFIPKGVNLNDAPAITSVLQPLKLLAEQHQSAVVIIQHMNKLSTGGGGGSFTANYGIGSVAVNALFRSVYTLGRIRDEKGKFTDIRALAPSKTNLVAGDPAAVLFELSRRNGFEWAGIDADVTAESLYEARRKGRNAEIKDQAKEFLQNELADGRKSSKELFEKAKDLGISEMTLKRARSELQINYEHEGRRKDKVVYWSLVKSDNQQSE